MMRTSPILNCIIATVLLISLPSFGASHKILFLRKAGKGFDDVFEVMKKDLEPKYNLSDFVVSRSTSYGEIKDKLMSSAPDLAVCMDNQAIGYAIKYNAEQTDAKKRIKGVAIMGLNLKSALKGNPDIAGIAFESPAYTLLVQFRFIVKKPIKNVLVFYRKSLFQEAIDETTKQLLSEGIKLDPVNVEADGASKEAFEKFIGTNLKKFAGRADQYDVVWVLLDSGILNQKLFQEFWLPAARESRIPFVSGAEELVSPNVDFATFAVTPNFGDLANQAVQQIESILVDHVAPKDLGVEELISVNKILNTNRAKALGLPLNEANLKDTKTVP